MTTTALFSGPTANASQAKNALTGAGFSVLAGDYDYGFSSSPVQTWTGERGKDGAPIPGTGEWVSEQPSYPTTFVAVEGGDVNTAVKAARQYGFILRASWPTESTMPVTKPAVAALAEKFDAQDQRLAELERALVALRGE